jgi:hypothetical protein
MKSELELLESINNDEDSSRQIFPEQYYVEEVYDSDNAEPGNTDYADLENADEEQIAITNNFLTGKMSFQDFITRVEYSNDLEESHDEEALENKKIYPEYFPEGISKAKTKRKLKSSEQLETGAVPRAKANVASCSCMDFPHQPPTSPVKKIKCVRVMKRLPANLLGNKVIF